MLPLTVTRQFNHQGRDILLEVDEIRAFWQGMHHSALLFYNKWPRLIWAYHILT